MDKVRKKEQALETRSREGEGRGLLVPFLMSFLDVFDFKTTCMYDCFLASVPRVKDREGVSK